MSRFVQLHLLTNYGPSNLNRDDTGRPKTVFMGNANRLRISSQSQKRAWRTSEVFGEALGDFKGTRTKRVGPELVFEKLKKAGIDEKKAIEWTKTIAQVFGKLKAENKKDPLQGLEIEQLVHLSPEELQAIDVLVDNIISKKAAPTDEELKLLVKPRQAVDIAMFGRMLADKPEFNVEAAVQVAHAFTVHKAPVEDDYFSAVDDLNKEEQTGAAHIGARGYGAGLFYLYICIDRELLKKNLGEDEGLTQRALQAFINTIARVSPTGMQNSFASRAYASYVLAEKGDQQPRSLAQAFLKPIASRHEDHDVLEESIDAINRRRQNFDQVYGKCSDQQYVVNVEKPEGSIEELIEFVAQ